MCSATDESHPYASCVQGEGAREWVRVEEQDVERIGPDALGDARRITVTQAEGNVNGICWRSRLHA